MEKFKFKKKDILHILLYCSYIIVYFFVLLKYGMGNSISNLRYYFLVVVVFISFIIILFRNKSNLKRLKCKKLLLIIPLGIILIIASYLSASSVGRTIHIRSFVQTSLVVLPALYAFSIVNFYDDENLIKIMRFTLVCTIITYFCEPGHSIFDFLKISNWTSMTFENSFLESSICSGAFLQLYFFFKYFCDFKGYQNLKMLKIISFIFNMMCFKRMGMLFSLFICLFIKKKNAEKNIPKFIYILLPIMFGILTVYYTKFVSGELDLFGINVYKFTTGRNYIMSLWRRTGYYSYGFGTALLMIGRYLEMDLVEIYLELGLLITIIFCFVYINISNKKLYSFLIIIFGMIGLLLSSSLPSLLTWILCFINISYLQCDEFDKKELAI